MSINDGENKLIEGSFKAYKRKGVFRVVLTKLGLTLYIGSEILDFIPAIGLVGCICMKESEKDGAFAYFSVCGYTSKAVSKKLYRKSYTFEVRDGTSFVENLNIANDWRCLVYQVIAEAHKKEKLRHISLRDPSKEILVLVNPKSGPGKAKEIYQKCVLPILSEAEIPHRMIITERADYGRNLIKTLNLNDFHAIVIVSGDGLVYEIYNGIMERDDWEASLSFPLGIIPGGSGNALARSLAYTVSDAYDSPCLCSALNLIYGCVHPLDLIRIETAKGQRMVSFLSVGFGLLADIDIGSEVLRALGESRFTIYALAKIVTLRKYQARFSFKRATISGHPEPVTAATSQKLLRSQTVVEEVATCEDIDNPKSLQHSASVGLENEENMTLSFTEGVERIDSPPVVTEALPQNEVTSLAPSTSADMPSFSRPLPEDWEILEGDFVFLYVVNMSHLSTNLLFVPDSKIDDGILWVVAMSGDCNKTTALKFLLAMDSGKHVSMPSVSLIPITAFRLEPLGKMGPLVVDGEAVEFERIQGIVMPQKGRLLVK